MQTSRFSRFSRLIAVAALASFAIAGCGGGGSSSRDDGAPEELLENSEPPPVLAPVVITPPTSNYADNRAEAFSYLNAQRLAGGVGAVLQSTTLDTASSGHSGYLAQNNTTGSAEVIGKPGFTGETVVDRTVAAGWEAGAKHLSEQILGGSATPKDAVIAMLSTVYDRAELLDHRAAEVGMSLAAPANQFVSMLGVQKTGALQGFVFADPVGVTPSVSVYPVPGGVDAPLTMVNSTPYPLVQPWDAANPPGFPVSIQFDAEAEFTITGFTLVDLASGQAVAGTVLTKDNDMWLSSAYRQFAYFVPAKALTASRSYDATVAASVFGKAFTKTWRFSTAVAKPF